MHRFSQSVVAACRQSTPEVLIATGMAPLTGAALRTCAQWGSYASIIRPTIRGTRHFAPFWHLAQSCRNMTRFSRRDARILATSPISAVARCIICPSAMTSGCRARRARFSKGTAPDVLFVGGADRDRVTFMTEFLRTGPARCLSRSLLATLSGDAPICPRSAGARSLVRADCCGQGESVPRAPRQPRRPRHAKLRNRRCRRLHAGRGYGRAPRNLRTGRSGGRLFPHSREAAARAGSLLADPAERARLSEAVRARVSCGAHTYRDRLITILEAASRIRRGRGKPRRDVVR